MHVYSKILDRAGDIFEDMVCTKDYERHHQVGYSLYISNDFAKISVSVERLLYSFLIQFGILG